MCRPPQLLPATALAALLGAFLAPHAAAQRPGFERGAPGDVYPQPAGLLLDETVLHQDTVGGARQELLDLAAGPRGFAAVWRDTRYGSLGLMLGLADADGLPLEVERPVQRPLPTRQFDPVLTLSGELGAVAWVRTAQRRWEVALRVFDGSGRFVGGTYPVADTAAGGRSNARALPAVALSDHGRGLVVWAGGDGVEGRRFRVELGGPGRASVEPEGEPFPLLAGGPPPLGPPTLAALPDGSFVAAWADADGTRLWTADARGTRERTLPVLGRPSLCVDPRDGRATLVVDGGEGARLFVLEPDLGTGHPRVLTGGAGELLAHAAAGPGHALARRTPDGSVELEFLPRDGGAATALALPDCAAGDLRLALAARDATLLVARTDLASADPDVFALAVPWGTTDPSALGPWQRWNTDRASADQSQPRVASDGRRHAVVVWQDARDGASRPWARRLGPDGGPTGGDFALDGPRADADGAASPVPGAPIRAPSGVPAEGDPAKRPPADGAVQEGALPSGPGPSAGGGAGASAAAAASEVLRPSVAVAADGAFLATWKQVEPGGRTARLWARAFGPDDRPLGAPLELDPAAGTDPGWSAAVEPLGDGWVCLWTRSGAGAVVAALARDGTPRGPARELPAGPRGAARNPDLCALDGGGWVALWDVLPERGPSVLSGALLDRALEPRGAPLAFESSPTGGGDLDPAAAPVEGGGFLVVWTGNDGPPRDVFGRFHDALGRPDGPPLLLSVLATEQDFPEVLRLPDGDWFASWEDDITGNDFVAGRRIGRDRVPGPRLHLSDERADYVVERTDNGIALLGGRLALVYTSRARSQGLDAVLRVLDADLRPAGESGGRR